MREWQKRVRGSIVMGLAWGLAWFAAGLVVLVVVGFGAADVPFPLFFGFLGFLAGAAFSAVLAIGERREFDQLSLPRFARWGALGGVLVAAVMTPAVGQAADFAVLGPVFALAGACSAAGSLALARRGSDRVLLIPKATERDLSADTPRKEIGGTE